MSSHRPWIVVCALVGCASCGSGAPTPGDVAIGQEFALAAFEATTVGPEALPVAFEAVVEDSRCPVDAMCIQAGRAVVQLLAGSARVRLEPGQSTPLDGHSLRLLAVEPHPSSGAVIEPSRYRASLVMER